MDILFTALKLTGYDAMGAASVLGVHARTIRDWRRGTYTIPRNDLESLARLANVDVHSLDFQELPDWWQTSSAGKKGGKAYIEKYKTIGTTATKRMGGAASYAKRKETAGEIFERKSITIPNESPELAEFIGIMIGDGGITHYQCFVTLNIKTDTEFAVYVGTLMTSLFGIEPTFQRREKSGCVVVVASSVELCSLLHTLGLPIGHKLKAGLDIPDWITCNQEYTKACLRGIFDTDGSIYQEVHKRGDKRYAYTRMAFVSFSEPLRETMLSALNDLGFAAKIRNNRCVIIERFTDIEEYFRMVKCSNPKHIRRFTAFGGVG